MRGGGWRPLAARSSLCVAWCNRSRELWPQGVHVAHVVVDGIIGPAGTATVNGEPKLDPDQMAEAYWHLARQRPPAWTLELAYSKNFSRCGRRSILWQHEVEHRRRGSLSLARRPISRLWRLPCSRKKAAELTRSSAALEGPRPELKGKREAPVAGAAGGGFDRAVEENARVILLVADIGDAGDDFDVLADLIVARQVEDDIRWDLRRDGGSAELASAQNSSET